MKGGPRQNGRSTAPTKAHRPRRRAFWAIAFWLVEIIEPARVEQRPERTYVGIRVITPFRGMLKVRDELLQELREWIDGSGTETIGHGFLRLHVIDMGGPMDIEAGYFTRQHCQGG